MRNVPASRPNTKVDADGEREGVGVGPYAAQGAARDEGQEPEVKVAHRRQEMTARAAG